MDSVSHSNADNATSSLGSLPDVISEAMYWNLMNAIVSLDFTAGVFATGTNIVTIIVYFRMGFADSTNISLTALAASDLGVALTSITLCLGLLLPSTLEVSFTELFLTTAAYPHTFLTRISALITAYISVERYLCVLLPLKIKSIITPRRTFAAMLLIFGAVFCLCPIPILKFPMGWKFDPMLNKTIFGIIPNADTTILKLHNIFLLIVSVILPISTFMTVVVCTILLSLSLQKSKAWRDKSSSNLVGKGATSSESSVKQSKEARAVKMVMTIATVFIVTSIPSCAHMVVMVAIPDFDFGGRYLLLYNLAGMFFVGANVINSGANVIIYYKMSHKFREAMLVVLWRKDAATATTARSQSLKDV